MTGDLPKGCELVKVQLPLGGSLQHRVDPQALVYNRDRTLWFTCEITPKIREAMGDRAKAFFYAAVDLDSREWTIAAEAPEQPW